MWDIEQYAGTDLVTSAAQLHRYISKKSNMSELIIQVIGGLLLTTILELWRRKSLGKPLRYNDETVLESKSYSPEGLTSNHSHSSIKAIIRLLLSPLIGLILAAVSSGILKAEGQSSIPLKSSLALVLIIIWTFIVWQILSRFGPLKGRKQVHSNQRNGKI